MKNKSLLALGVTCVITTGSANATTYASTYKNTSLPLSTASIELPECSVNYNTLSEEYVQKIAFYVTNDTLEFGTKEEIESWAQAQIDYGNQALQNSCVKLKQEIKLIRYVSTPDNIPRYANPGKVYYKEDLNVVRYLSLLTEPLFNNHDNVIGETQSLMHDDWRKFGIDRIVHVKPFYDTTATNTLCGVAYGHVSRPNLDPITHEQAPTNGWGEQLASSNSMVSVVYPNYEACSQKELVAHELGHSNGLLHERGQQQTSNWPEALGYASKCGGVKSIMYSGLGNNSAVPFFSTPNIHIEGEACGDNSQEFGVDSTETLAYNLGISHKHATPKEIPHQGKVDAGNHQAVGDSSTWNTITSQRHGNMAVYGEVNIGVAPATITDSDGSFQVDVVRSDSTHSGSVVLKLTGSSSVIAGEDFEAEQEVHFAAGETSKSVEIKTYLSGLKRSTGTFTINLHSPYQVSIGELNSSIVAYLPNESGTHGTVEISKAEYACVDSGCVNGTVTLSRIGGKDGDIDFSLRVMGKDGQIVTTQSVKFYDGEVEKIVNLSVSQDKTLYNARVNLMGAHSATIKKNQLMLQPESSVTPTPEPEVPNQGGGVGSDTSGGSAGIFSTLFLLMLFRLRKK